MKAKTLCAAVALVVSANASADIAREVQNSGYGKGSFAEAGIVLSKTSEDLIGLNVDDDNSDGVVISLDIGLEGRFEYKRAFIEFIDESFNNITLGFNAYSTENSHHEVIVTSLFDEITRKGIQGYESIEDRKLDIEAGVRSSFYFDNNIVQFELLSDVNDSHKGMVGSLQFGHQTQVRNWNLHGIAGVRYFTDNVIDHLFGVSSTEATAELPAYQAGNGFMPTIQLGATLPINEKWIFRASADYSMLPSSVTDSPLAEGDSIYNLGLGLHYVIYGG